MCVCGSFFIRGKLVARSGEANLCIPSLRKSSRLEKICCCWKGGNKTIALMDMYSAPKQESKTFEIVQII